MKHDNSAFRAVEAYAGSRAIEDRIRRFLPMVRRAAWHINGSGCEGLEVDDLIQAGLVALTECARRHSGPGEDGFAAYAKIRVRGAMFDLVRKSIPGSRGAAARRRRLAGAQSALRQHLGREPLPAELAEELGIDQSELADFTSEPVRVASLEEVYDERNASYADDRPDPFELLSGAENSARLADLIAALPDRLKLVLQLYFVEELNLAEIADVLSVSVPRIHQLKAQAIKHLRERLVGDMATLR